MNYKTKSNEIVTANPVIPSEVSIYFMIQTDLLSIMNKKTEN